jgi:hypothetical protein
MIFNRKSTVLIFIVCAVLTSLGGFSQIETEENELEIENVIVESYYDMDSDAYNFISR